MLGLAVLLVFGGILAVLIGVYSEYKKTNERLDRIIERIKQTEDEMIAVELYLLLKESEK